MKVQIFRIICMVLASAILLSCAWFAAPDEVDHREEMRQLVISLSGYARASEPGFIVIPQNGQELLTLDGMPDGPIHRNYANAVDGSGREDLFFGYAGDNLETPADEMQWMRDFCDLMEAEGIEILTTDYIWTSESAVDDAYALNADRGYIAYTPPSRELDGIPDYPTLPFGNNTDEILSLADAANFLYLLNPGNFPSLEEYLTTLEEANYDILIVDAFYDGAILSASEVGRIRQKPGGSSRLVIAYLSIGEAEDYRYYWEPAWAGNPPSWLEGENPDWDGNYLVRYWDPAWQALLFGDPDAYLDRILLSGFDGVYLDIIDAFERFE
jgi:cysteinyl-tRNA synthetase